MLDAFFDSDLPKTGGGEPLVYLAFYADHFHTVEVDSPFYACPSARTVTNWAARNGLAFLREEKSFEPEALEHWFFLIFEKPKP